MQLRALRPVPAAVALAAVLAGVAGAGTSGGTVAAARNGVLGSIHVNGAGRTLYHAAAGCTGSCTLRFTPLVVSGSGRPVAGAGVRATWLATVKRRDGRLQVAYHGLSLYLFTGDTRAGQVNGQGVGGAWHAVAPSGVVVTKTVPSTSTGSGSGSGDVSGSGSMTTTGPSPTVNPGMWCAANPTQCVNGVPIGH
jgi:predicted lipoprotein with Yx(FWY)xxD motif